MFMRLAIMVSALTAAQPSILPAPPPFAVDPAQEAAALHWIATTGHPLSGPSPTDAELAPILARLHGARVIGLGEATHGDHEDQLFKANLLRALIRAGAVNAIAMELNRSTGGELDRYVRLGDGQPADILRREGFYRAWADHEFADLLVWLRDWNRTARRKVRIFGIDNQSASNDSIFSLAFIARHDAKLADALRAPLGTLVPEAGQHAPRILAWTRTMDAAGIQHAIAAARTIVDAFAGHRAEWSRDPGYAEAAYAAETAWQNLREYELEVKGSTFGAKRPDGYYARRDKFMAINLLALTGSGDRTAFWAHNLHVSHAVPANEPQSTAVGLEIRRAIGDAYRCVGFTWSTGSIATVVGDLGKVTAQNAESELPLVNNRPGEIGSLFDRTGRAAMWIDMTKRPHNALLDGWNRTPYWFGTAGWGVDPARWQNEASTVGDEADLDQLYDILVWFRRITPARRLP